MSSQKKILINYIFWFITLFFIIFIGVSDVFGLETKSIYAGNNNGTLTDINRYNYGFINQGGTQSITQASVNTSVSGVAYYFGFYYYDNIVLNNTYTLVINFYDSDLLNTFQSGWVDVQTCYSSTCNVSTIVSVVKNNNSGNSNKLTIKFNPTTVGSYVLVMLARNAGQPITGINTFGIRNIQVESSNTNQDIINNNTQNSNNIINNQNQNTQDIINNQNSSSSAIMENQNSNTDKEIESQKVCSKTSITETYVSIKSKFLNASGVLINATSSIGVTDYLSITPGSDLVVTKPTTNGGAYLCLYNIDKSLSRCIEERSLSINSIVTTSSLEYYVRFSINYNSTGNYSKSPYFDIVYCQNGNQALSDNINNLNDSLTSETPPDTSGLGNVAGWLPPGPVDSILTLPLTFLNSLNNAIGGSCSPINVNLPFVNKTLNLPCFINFMQQYLPNFNTLYNWIGGIVSVYILFNYLLTLYKWVDDTLSLRENTMPGYFDDRFGGGA